MPTYKRRTRHRTRTRTRTRGGGGGGKKSASELVPSLKQNATDKTRQTTLTNEQQRTQSRLDKKIKADKEWWKTFKRNGKKIFRTTVKAAAAVTGGVVLRSLIVKQAKQAKHLMEGHPNLVLVRNIVTEGDKICERLSCEKCPIAFVDGVKNLKAALNTGNIHTDEQYKDFRKTTLDKLKQYYNTLLTKSGNHKLSDADLSGLVDLGVLIHGVTHNHHILPLSNNGSLINES